MKLGADDYIVKPFQIGELTARVEALLKRYGKINKKLFFADVEIDMVSRTVKRSGDDKIGIDYDFWTQRKGFTKSTGRQLGNSFYMRINMQVC